MPTKSKNQYYWDSIEYIAKFPNKYRSNSYKKCEHPANKMQTPIITIFMPFEEFGILSLDHIL